MIRIIQVENKNLGLPPPIKTEELRRPPIKQNPGEMATVIISLLVGFAADISIIILGIFMYQKMVYQVEKAMAINVFVFIGFSLVFQILCTLCVCNDQMYSKLKNIIFWFLFGKITFQSFLLYSSLFNPAYGALLESIWIPTVHMIDGLINIITMGSLLSILESKHSLYTICGIIASLYYYLMQLGFPLFWMAHDLNKIFGATWGGYLATSIPFIYYFGWGLSVGLLVLFRLRSYGEVKGWYYTLSCVGRLLLDVYCICYIIVYQSGIDNFTFVPIFFDLVFQVALEVLIIIPLVRGGSACAGEEVAYSHIPQVIPMHRKLNAIPHSN